MELNKENLYNEYIIKNLSRTECSKVFDCSDSLIQKRLKILSYFEVSVGVPCIILACLPIWTEEQKNIKNLLLGTGTASVASGLITFTFTINF